MSRFMQTDSDLTNSKLTPFGEFVREMRMARGKYLKNMADFIGLSSAYLSGVEFGRNELTKEILQKTFEFFNSEGEPVAWLDEECLRAYHCSETNGGDGLEPLYRHPPRQIDAETKKLVLELLSEFKHDILNFSEFCSLSENDEIRLKNIENALEKLGGWR